MQVDIHVAKYPRFSFSRHSLESALIAIRPELRPNEYLDHDGVFLIGSVQEIQRFAHHLVETTTEMLQEAAASLDLPEGSLAVSLDDVSSGKVTLGPL